MGRMLSVIVAVFLGVLVAAGSFAAVTNTGRVTAGPLGRHMLSEARVMQATSILYAPSDPDDPAFRAAVAAITGGTVDYFDARDATPDLATLQGYDCVYTWANYPYSDNVLFGDRLAAFVDGGGSVVLGVWAVPSAGNHLDGAILGPGYSPVTGASGHYETSSYAGDGTTFIHDGVTAYDSFFRDVLTLQGGGLQDGSYLDGEIAHAYRPDFRVIYSNGGGVDTLGGAGDWPLLIANACRAAEPILYGATGVAGEASSFYRIDPATGQATLIGPIGFSGVTGLAFLPDGRLVASANTGNASILIEINRATGAGTLIGVIGDSSAGGCVRMPDLTYDSNRGRLLGYGDDCSVDPEGLHTIDPMTGQGTPIGPSGYNGGGNGLAWEPATDTLYGTPFDNESLVIFDPVTGAGSDVPGSAGNVPYRVNALAFHPVTGVLYGSWNSTSAWYLVTVDLADGTATTIGQSVDRLDALIFGAGHGAPPPQSATVTVAVGPDGGGTVSGGGVYDIGEIVTVEAFPSAGWVFLHWLVNGSEITDNPYTFEVTGDVTLTAIFQRQAAEPIPAAGTVGLVLLLGLLLGAGVFVVRRLA